MEESYVGLPRKVTVLQKKKPTIKRPIVAHDRERLEFCSNCGLRTVLRGPAWALRTLAGLPVKT